MMSKPCPAARASVDWNSEMLRGWMMTYSASSSLTALFIPSSIMSLKERSPIPDSDVTKATFTFASTALADATMAANATDAPIFSADLNMTLSLLFDLLLRDLLRRTGAFGVLHELLHPCGIKLAEGGR